VPAPERDASANHVRDLPAGEDVMSNADTAKDEALCGTSYKSKANAGGKAKEDTLLGYNTDCSQPPRGKISKTMTGKNRHPLLPPDHSQTDTHTPMRVMSNTLLYLSE
jgi:hypothetical protein